MGDAHKEIDQQADTLKGFSQRWNDFPDYIIGITKEIWEERGIETLNRYYSDTIPVRTPMGIQYGNQAVIASTMATLHEFPDRQLYAEDVIWSGDEKIGYLSSHRLLTTGTHLGLGAFGEPSGKRFLIRAIADCAAKSDTIFDEWLIRDYGGMVRQFGFEPKTFAKELIIREGGAERCSQPLTPATDVEGDYLGKGNDNEWGVAYANILTRLMNKEFSLIPDYYDRAVIGQYAGARTSISHGQVGEFWMALRSAFPHATFTIHHQIGMDADMSSPRAAIRWSLDGKHEGQGAFGPPSGADVHVMGMSHAEFGRWGLRREYTLYDEVAIWKQILMQTGDLT